ncbi:MAG: hypothetical protein DSY80_04670 [Desulfocapsa sp.]|nr:MAG: hypothetical protein DSY80_04670 [Desulfocapsa sp.]
MAIISAGALAMASTSAIAGKSSGGQQQQQQGGQWQQQQGGGGQWQRKCYNKKYRYRTWATVWRTKRYYSKYAGGYVYKKYPKRIKVWRSGWKRICR